MGSKRAPKVFWTWFLASVVTFLEGGFVYTCKASIVPMLFLDIVHSKKHFLNDGSIVTIQGALSTAQGKWEKKMFIGYRGADGEVKTGSSALSHPLHSRPGCPSSHVSTGSGSFPLDCAVWSPWWLPTLSCAPADGYLQGILLDSHSGKQREVL